MEIKRNVKSNTVELYSSGAKSPSLIVPSRLVDDLKDRGAADGIRGDSDKWLLGEMRYNGEPHRIDNVCWNCGGTLGFLAPTGEKRTAKRIAWRSDGKESPFCRKLVFYPCPVCAGGGIKTNWAKVWLEDQDAITEALSNIWWGFKGREEMEASVKAAIARYTIGDVGGSLCLVGPYGCGKSTLAAEIVRACNDSNIPALYVSAARFKKAIYDSLEGSTVLDMIRGTPVVVFDQPDWIRETKSDGTTSFAAEKARDIFAARYDMRRSKATIYVINVTAWEQGGNDALSAIYDRMREGEVARCDVSGAREYIGKMQQASFAD